MTIQTHQAISIEEDVREGIALILDALLPGTERLPSGRQVAAHQELLDKVLSADPTLEPAMTTAGQLAAQAGACRLADLEQWSGPNLERVVFTLNSAYYMSSEVRGVLGYPGQARRPIAQATPEEVVSDDLVAPVVDRGAIYVPTPD